MNKIWLAFFVLTLYSCEGERKEIIYEPSEWRMTYDDYDYLMKYVYVDKNNCLHVSRECEVLDSVYQVEFVDTAYVLREYFDRFCSECVNIPRYEHLDKILIRNEIKKKKLPLKEPDIITWEPNSR